MIHVTSHAVARFQERVQNIPEAEVVAFLSGMRFIRAVLFGASYVKLGTGQHVVFEGETIVTILPRDHHVGTFDPKRQRTAEQCNSGKSVVRDRHDPDLRCAGRVRGMKGYWSA